VQEFVVIKEWAGKSGHVETEKFKTVGDRISITVRNGAGGLVKLATNLGQKITSGHFDVAAAEGEYYLEIDSADRNWQVAAQQPGK
jgi:hypothetical protein